MATKAKASKKAAPKKAAKKVTPKAVKVVPHIAPDNSLKEAASVIRAANHPIRNTILQLLKDNDRLNVQSLQQLLGIEQSVTSSMLRTLRLAKLVSTEKDGKQVFYSRNEATIATMTEHVNALSELLD